MFSEVVTSITREDIMPGVFDTILAGNTGVLRLLGNSQPWGSGFRKEVIVKYQKSTVGGLVGIGGTLDTTRQNTRTRLQFDPKRRHKAVVADDLEVTLNQGDEQVVDLLVAEMQSIAQDLADDFGADFYEGTGSGAQFDSILNASDDSTNFSTYGSKSRSTYSSLNGYLATGIGTLALSDLSTLHSTVKIGMDKPSIMLADTTSWIAYEGLLTPVVRAGYQTNGYPQVTRTGTIESKKALGGELGFDSIYYRGTPVVEDEKCTSGYMFAFNEKYFKFFAINLKGYNQVNIKEDPVDGPQAVPLPTRGFNWSGFDKSVTQPAKVGHVYITGNFVAMDPRRAGNLQGITG